MSVRSIIRSVVVSMRSIIKSAVVSVRSIRSDLGISETSVTANVTGIAIAIGIGTATAIATVPTAIGTVVTGIATGIGRDATATIIETGAVTPPIGTTTIGATATLTPGATTTTGAMSITGATCTPGATTITTAPTGAIGATSCVVKMTGENASGTRSHRRMSLGARAPHGGKTPRRADPHRAAATEGRRGPSHEMMSAVVSVGAVLSFHTVSDAGALAEQGLL